nr:hypothetical protein [uncultured bacterium]
MTGDARDVMCVPKCTHRDDAGIEVQSATAGCTTVTRSRKKRCPACWTMAARSRRSPLGVFTLDRTSWILGIHSKCRDGSITVTEWCRDSFIAAVKPAKLPPTMAMRLPFSVMGSLMQQFRSCAVCPSGGPAKGGLSFLNVAPLELRRQLDAYYSTAWRMKHKVVDAMRLANGPSGRLSAR